MLGRIHLIVLLVLLIHPKAPAASPTVRTCRLYVGAYNTPDNPGIQRCTFDLETGRLGEPTLAATTPNPSFLALHPTGRFLYAVNETDRTGSEAGGSVTAFAIDPATGALRILNTQNTRGAHPCHVALDPQGRFVAVANYSGGSVAMFACLPDGRLGETTAFVEHRGSGPNRARQDKPHAHGVYFDATGQHLLVPDLGVDRVLVYRVGQDSGQLEAVPSADLVLAPGSGPRHLASHPDQVSVYVVNELLSTVTACTWNTKTPRLEPVQTLGTLPEVFTGRNTTAEIAVHPQGDRVYASNRGHDSIAVFAVEAGRLTVAGHLATGGRTPRHFALDPTGQWLLSAHQDSNSIQVFRVNPTTRQLIAEGKPVQVAKPVCLLFAQ